MTNTDVAAPARQQPRLPIQPIKQRDYRRVAPKLAKAIDLIVFEGADLQTAAAGAGLTSYTVRQAFGRPHVIAHLKARREVFRAEVAAQNIHRARQIRDAADNQPAVNAMKFIEDYGRQQAIDDGARRSPHMTIQILNVSAPTQHDRDTDLQATVMPSNADRLTDMQSDGHATIPNSADRDDRGESSRS